MDSGRWTFSYLAHSHPVMPISAVAFVANNEAYSISHFVGRSPSVEAASKKRESFFCQVVKPYCPVIKLMILIYSYFERTQIFTPTLQNTYKNTNRAIIGSNISNYWGQAGDDVWHIKESLRSWSPTWIEALTKETSCSFPVNIFLSHKLKAFSKRGTFQKERSYIFVSKRKPEVLYIPCRYSITLVYKDNRWTDASWWKINISTHCPTGVLK